MRRFEIVQSATDTLTSHSGLALVGRAIARTNLAKDLATIPLRHGIAHADCVKSYVGLLCTGKSVLPDGRLASGSHDNTIRLWNLASGGEAALLEGHTSAVSALCVLSGRRLASGSHDNTIRLWGLASG